MIGTLIIIQEDILTNWQHRMRNVGFISYWFAELPGVPQGSLFGPSLFVLFCILLIQSRLLGFCMNWFFYDSPISLQSLIPKTEKLVAVLSIGLECFIRVELSGGL